MLLKRLYDGLVKKVNTIDSEEQNLEKKIKDVDKKIPDMSKYIETQNLNRSTTTDNVLLDPRQRVFNHLNNLIFEKVNFGPKI